LSSARIAVATAVLGTVFGTTGAAREDPTLPEGNAYVRSAIGGARSQDALINDYAYDLEETRENLDKEGRVTSRASRAYEVYFVLTRPVRRLVSRNGVPLSPKEQAEADGKAEAQAKAIAGGRTVNERSGMRLSSLLDSFVFRTVGREERAGRPTLVFEFEPRGNPERKSAEGRATDALARILTGRLLVDEADRRVVRLEARSRPGQKASVATGVKVGTFELIMEFVPVEGRVWLPRRVTTVTKGRAFLFRTFRVRQTTIYSNYRRFRVTTDERPAG
jgi:hypothetical protein